MQGESRIPKRLKSMLVLGFRQFWDPYYQGFAAQIAFYIILSFVPTVIIVSQLLSLVNISLVDVNEIVDQMADPEVGRLLKRLLSTRLTAGNNVMLAITALWASSRMEFAMMRISNYLYSNGRTTGDYIAERIRSLKNMSLTVFIFAFIGMILVNGPMIIELLFGNILEGTYINTIWKNARWPIMGLLYFMLVLHNYWMLPNYNLRIPRLSISDVFPGSVFAAVGMVLVTYVYSMYNGSRSAQMSALYGSLSSVVALMIWFYILSWVMILGMLFNKVWMDTRDEEDREVGH